MGKETGGGKTSGAKGGFGGKNTGKGGGTMGTMMQAFKGAASGAKPGDWTCPNCGDNVFASRDACRQCGTSKPGGAAGGKGGGKAGCKWCEMGECWTHGAGKG